MNKEIRMKILNKAYDLHWRFDENEARKMGKLAVLEFIDMKNEGYFEWFNDHNYNTVFGVKESIRRDVIKLLIDWEKELDL